MHIIGIHEVEDMPVLIHAYFWMYIVLFEKREMQIIASY